MFVFGLGFGVVCVCVCVCVCGQLAGKHCGVVPGEIGENKNIEL